MSFARSWSEEWALHPLAVHFCSLAHKEAYQQRFLESPSVESGDVESSSGLEAHLALASGLTLTSAVMERAVKARKRSGRRRPSKDKLRFSRADIFRAHALGVCLRKNAQK
jgi:hypothetical protein